MPEDISCDYSSLNSTDLLAMYKQIEYVQQRLAEITAPIIEIQRSFIENVDKHYPEILLEFKKQIREFLERWNKYILSCLGNIDDDIFKVPDCSVYNLESARSVDTIDVNHSNSPPKHLSLKEQAIENFRSNMNEYNHSKICKFVKREFPEIIRAIVYQFILNMLFH